MNGEKLKEVIEILSRYNNESLVDYYELFGFDKNSSLEELKNQIRKKRLQILFHPDQIHFIPQEYHEKYLKMIELVKDVVNTFDSYQNKENYDIKLKQTQGFTNNSYYNYSNNDNKNSNTNSNNRYSNVNNNNNNNNNNYSNSNANNDNNYNSRNSNNDNNNNYNNTNYNNSSNDFKKEDLDEIAFKKAIIATAEKHGYLFALDAIYNYLQYDMLRGFTSTNNARNIVAGLDKNKIRNIIMLSSVTDDINEIRNQRQLIMNYLTDLIYNTPSLKLQLDCLEQACINTISKYDLNGNYGQTKMALDRYCKNGDVSAFTNTNNGRMKLQYNVDYKNAMFFMQCSLNKRRHQDYKYAYENVVNLGSDNITKLYSDELMQNVNNYSNEYNDGSYGR